MPIPPRRAWMSTAILSLKRITMKKVTGRGAVIRKEFLSIFIITGDITVTGTDSGTVLTITGFIIRGTFPITEGITDPTGGLAGVMAGADITAGDILTTTPLIITAGITDIIPAITYPTTGAAAIQTIAGLQLRPEAEAAPLLPAKGPIAGVKLQDASTATM